MTSGSIESAAVRPDTPTVTDPVLWQLAGALAVFDAVAVARLGWTVQPWPFIGAGLTIALFAGLGAFFQSRDLAWSRVFCALGLAMALAYTCQTATYVLGTTGAPFREIGRVGALIGFHWPVWHAWVLAHPDLHAALALVYPQHFASAAVAIVLLAFSDRGANRFLRAFVIAFAVCAVGQLVAPAFTNTPDAPSNAVRLALRDGSFSTLDFTQGVGLISFPSMHAALAVMVCVALWSFRWIRVPLAIFTALMLVSIPSEGGHYLVDVLAGSMLGVVAWRYA